MSGPNRRQYVLPDIGIRATQGHSLRDVIGPEYLMAAQERLSLDNKESLRNFCVYGTGPMSRRSIADSHSLIPGGIDGNRVAVLFCSEPPWWPRTHCFWIGDEFQHLHLLLFETMVEIWKSGISLS